MIRLFISAFALLVGIVLLVPALLILIPLWIFNLSVNLLHSLLTRKATSWRNILEFAPTVGWKPRPNLNAKYFDRIGDSCSIITDAEGWPGNQTIEDSDVVVYGDSFAFGYGSKVENTFYSVSKQCKIKAIGAPGYNMVQELILMRQHAYRLTGKVVVWFACIENDLVENLKAYRSKLSYPNPFLRREAKGESWEIVADHVQAREWISGSDGISNKVLFAHLCTPCSYSERIISATSYLVEQAKETCVASGAELVIFAIPYKQIMSHSGRKKIKAVLKQQEGFDPEYPEKKLTEICRANGVPIIVGASSFDLKDYKERDGHWNQSGNRKAADMIKEYYQMSCIDNKAYKGAEKFEWNAANEFPRRGEVFN